MMPRPFRVAAKRRETADTCTLSLEPERGAEPISPAPGQFNMLYAFGVGEVPISATSEPGHSERLVHTIRDVGPVTGALCRLRKGDILGVRGPFGSGWPLEEAEGDDLLLVAGGIGLAPLRPAFEYLLAHRRRYGKVTLLCGFRTPRDLIARRQLERWRGSFGVEVEVTVDSATEDWFGPVGTILRLISRVELDGFETVALLCGPEVMMRFAVRELRARGVPPERIYLSMERNMKCAIGLCGHCQLGPHFICKDGPVLSYPQLAHWLAIRGA